jgi:tape measure domain-containing protein
MTNAGRSADGLQSAVSRVAAAVAAAFSTRQILAYADAYTNIQNQLRIVTNGTQELTNVTAQLLQVANDTRAAFDATADLYSKLARSTEELGISQDRLIKITETINKTFATSGASADAARNAIIQLGQGLSAGALRGDEFNSVAEQAPGILRAVSAETGKTIGQLREFAATGGITSELLIRAIENYADTVDKEFARTNRTFEQSLQLARNNAVAFIGANEQVQTASKAAGNAIISLSNNIEAAGKALLAVAAVVTGRYVVAISAATIAQANYIRQSAAENVVTINGAVAQREKAAALVATTTAAAAAAAANVRLAQSEVAAFTAVVNNIKAEIELETVRLGAQISNQGRVESIRRLAASRIELSAATKALTAAEAQLSAANAVNTTATTANTTATNAYTAAAARATLGARALAAASTLAGRAMALLGGPAGLILIAASAFLIFANNADKAREKSELLKTELDNQIAKFKELNEQGQRLTFQKLTNEQIALSAQLREATAEAERLKVAADKAASGGSFAAGASQLAAYSRQQGIVAELGERLNKITETQTTLFNLGIPPITQSTEALKGNGEAVGVLADNLDALRKVSSGIDSLFTGEFNLFGDEETNDQSDEQQARINARIASLRQETAAISSELALQQSVRNGFISQEIAELDLLTANKIQKAITERELLLAEKGITYEQQLAAEDAFQMQMAAIAANYAEMRKQADLDTLATQAQYAQQLQDIQLNTATAALNGISAFAKQGSGIQKALFIALKGIQAAQAYTSGLTAAMLARATIPYPFSEPIALAQITAGKVSAAAILATGIAGAIGGGGGGRVGGSGASVPSATQSLPTTPTSAPLVGSVEIRGLQSLTDELRNSDAQLPAPYVARILDAIQSANRLRGEDI